MNLVSVAEKTAEKPYRQLVEEFGSPLMVLDCDVVRQRYQSLSSALPGVGLFYAIKSLPDPTIVSVLYEQGAGFDVATTGELRLLKKAGVPARSTIHTHPIKREQDIVDGLEFGCTTFVVDNIDELEKFVKFRDRAELLLRVSFRSKDASIDLSRKFGCGVRHVPRLLAAAAQRGIRIKGLSFHVGSQSLTSLAHVKAVKACRKFFENPDLPGAENLTILDIGGGFPVDYTRQGLDLQAFCKPIVAALAEYPRHVKVIAEPGRVLSAATLTSVSTIVGRAERGGLWWYYLDDGVYGAYSGQIFDYVHYPITLFSDQADASPSVLAGPTCDSVDVITELAMLPKLEIGDLVVGEMMGAYSYATASEFNSLPKPRVVAVNREEVAVVKEKKTSAGR